MALATGVGLAAAVNHWTRPARWTLANLSRLLPPCPIRTLTGLQCPGCGGTHCLLALLRGDFASAFHHNALLALLLPAVALLLAQHLVATARHRSSIAADLLRSRVAFGVLGAATLLFGVVRNLS